MKVLSFEFICILDLLKVSKLFILNKSNIQKIFISNFN